MFNFFKPTIRARLVKGGTQAKVSLMHLTAEQTMILLFMTIKQIANALGMEHRQLINKVIELDVQITRGKKQAAREARRESYKSNSQKS